MTNQPTPLRRRILIIEDHALLSAGIKELLSAEAGYDVVGEVNDGLQAYAACQQLHPCVALIDLGLPQMGGMDVMRQLKRRWPELTAIIVTADATECRAREALDSGASAYVLKKSPQQTLLAALHIALRGETFLDPALDKAQVTALPTLGGHTQLTPRERQVLKLISEGDRNRQIAEKLSISIKTVETHRLNLMRKLQAHNIAALVQWSRRLGIC